MATKSVSLLTSVWKAKNACAHSFRDQLWNCPSATISQERNSLFARWHNTQTENLGIAWLAFIFHDTSALEFKSLHPRQVFGQILQHGTLSMSCVQKTIRITNENTVVRLEIYKSSVTLYHIQVLYML